MDGFSISKRERSPSPDVMAAIQAMKKKHAADGKKHVSRKLRVVVGTLLAYYVSRSGHVTLGLITWLWDWSRDSGTDHVTLTLITWLWHWSRDFVTNQVRWADLEERESALKRQKIGFHIGSGWNQELPELYSATRDNTWQHGTCFNHDVATPILNSTRIVL